LTGVLDLYDLLFVPRLGGLPGDLLLVDTCLLAGVIPALDLLLEVDFLPS